MKTFLMVLLVGLASPALAQEPDIPAGPSGIGIDLNGDGKVDANEVLVVYGSDVDAGNLTQDLHHLVNAVQDMKDDSTAKVAGVAALLAVVFKLLLSLLKLIAKTEFFSTRKGKRIVKYSTLGLGALAGLAANLSFGVSWIEALMIFASGPLAVAFHEYTKDSKESAGG